MKPKSDNLFHFTSSMEVLKLILGSKIYPRFCLEDISWFGLENHKYIAFPMSCFCDIPLSRITEHTDFYGSFGIGFTKEWGKKNNLHPVVYSTNGGQIQEVMKYLSDHIEANETSELNAYRLWSLLKPITGNMYISGETVEKDFYQECEWRYVPPVQDVIFEKSFADDRDESNKNMEQYGLEFSPNDIKYIFVKNDSDIPSLIDFINSNTKLGSYPMNDLKILQTRIVSLDTLKADL